MPTGAGPSDPEGWAVIALYLPLLTDLFVKSGAGGAEFVPQIFICSHGPEVKPGNYSRSFFSKKVGEIIPSETEWKILM